MIIGYLGTVEFSATVVTSPVTLRSDRGDAYWSFSVNDDESHRPAGYDVGKALDPTITVLCSKTHPKFASEMTVGAKCYVCGYPDITKKGAAPFGGKMELVIWKMMLPNGDWI